jgi:hypothetical protein
MNRFSYPSASVSDQWYFVDFNVCALMIGTFYAWILSMEMVFEQPNRAHCRRNPSNLLLLVHGEWAVIWQTSLRLSVTQ